ncbi:MAG: hypothetical protein ACKO5M_01620, partial [Vulcanococcus sp.]
PPGWPAYVPPPAAAAPPAPPPPPAPPAPPPAAPSAESVRLALTEQQLSEARQRLAEMEGLLRDLPEIFERKFQQRLQPLLERHDRLLEDNQQLRQQMRQLTATNAEMRQLPPARTAAGTIAEAGEATPAASAPQPAPPLSPVQAQPHQAIDGGSGLRLPNLPGRPPQRWSFLGGNGKGRAA